MTCHNKRTASVRTGVFNVLCQRNRSVNVAIAENLDNDPAQVDN